MLRQWLWIGVLLLVGVPLWAQNTKERAIKREREEMVSEQRVALVIGNEAYTGSVPSLRNPVNDAQGMAQALENIGFKVIPLYNADKSQIGEAIYQFSELIDSKGVALFYFSGHGVEVDGINYLVPIGAKIQKEYQVKYECNSANEILDMMEEKRGNRINVVILDACRDNPFKTRSIGGHGLVAMPSSPGSLIAYAASAGNVAKDGAGNHSPYTESLIKHIQTPGLEIEDVFKAVGKDVLRATKNAQNPGRYSNLNDDFYLIPLSSTNSDTLLALPSPLPSLLPSPLPSPSILTETLSGDVKMEFVWISPGTFMMGSPSSEAGRGEYEGPVHTVEIGQGFYLGKYEVTQGQWEAVMGTQPWVDEEHSQYVRSEPNNPVVYVSWEDAQAFVSKLNDAAGSGVYRLPTEAEWEYACRAGTSTRWSFGDAESLLTHYAWYEDNACDVRDCYAQAVGTKRENPWGLYDMHGNVGEWVQDWWSVYNRSPLVDPTGPTAGSHRIMRGGYFGNYARFVRSASRRYLSPGTRVNSIGFRLLRRAN